MTNIAPLFPFTQPAQHSAPPAAIGIGSDNAFGSILNDTVSARQTASHKPSQGQTTSRQAVAIAEKNQNNTDDLAFDLQADSSENQADAAFVEGGVQTIINSASISESFLQPATKTGTRPQPETSTALRSATVQPMSISTEDNSKLQQITGKQPTDHLAQNRIDRIISEPWSPALQTMAEEPRLTSQSTEVFMTGRAQTAGDQIQSRPEPILSAQLQQLIESNEKGVITITRQSATKASLDDLNALRPSGQPALTLTPATGAKILEMGTLSQSTDIRSKIFDAVLNQNENTGTRPQPITANTGNDSNTAQAQLYTPVSTGPGVAQVTPPAKAELLTDPYIDTRPTPSGAAQAANPLNTHSNQAAADRVSTFRAGVITPSSEPSQLRSLNNPTNQPQTTIVESPITVTASQFTATQETIGKPSAERPAPADLEPLRQDARSQYLKGTIEARTRNDSNNQHQQSNEQERSANVQLQPNTQTTSPAAVPEQSTSFSQVSQGVLSQSTPQPTATVTQPVLPTPSPQVYEESVMNQVAERFQIYNRKQETQVNIKLHPVELGELKIELNMKDGNMRAHVIAQTGQVQQILEKNMPRLREMLQSQGMQLEEILVSTQAENVGEFDLPGDQLSKRDTNQRQDRQNIDTTFKDTFEAIVTEEAPANGVNVKV